uniref:Uncharacterized protein n=1 Tax=Manihot esculenta TaxID=3983 RepID=A0A2C9U4J8_MANES
MSVGPFARSAQGEGMCGSWGVSVEVEPMREGLCIGWSTGVLVSVSVGHMLVLGPLCMNAEGGSHVHAR